MHDFSTLDLNNQQLSVVQETKLPIIVIAGAGSGKTKTIISKIHHFVISSIADPKQIVAVTFTNKSAEELRTRLSHLSNGFNVGTFHKISMNMIEDLKKSHCDILPKRMQQINSTSILTTEEQANIVRRIAKSNNFQSSLYSLLNTINGIKERLFTATSTEDQKLFEQYQEELYKTNMFDFSDLLLQIVDLWENNPNILELSRSKIRLLCVDEYQDINNLQFQWISLLYNENLHLCCVGDSDQSIYKFRGSNIKHILNFQQNFQNSKLIKLETNYRSNPDILDKANALIGYNQHRITKILNPNKNCDEKSVHLHEYSSDLEESAAISRLIVNNLSTKTIGILVREKQQATNIEHCLVKQQIKYTTTGLHNFIDKAIIKDMLSYLKFANNTKDSINFRRAILSPRRGIGETTIKKIIDQSANSDIYLSAKMIHKKPINDFLDIIDYIKSSTTSLDKIMRYIYEKSGYSSALSPNQDLILREWFLSLSDKYSIEEYLSLILWQEQTNKTSLVNLMTIHASKGLEFDHVFLPAWEEGIIPHALSRNDHDIEEERRLGYVAITRAKSSVYLSYAKKRMQHGRLCSNHPSRFIREMFSKQNIANQSKILDKRKQHSFEINDMVMHDKFGLGYIIDMDSEYIKVKFTEGAHIVEAHVLRKC